jgi:hypothetical protein
MVEAPNLGKKKRKYNNGTTHIFSFPILNSREER